MRYWPSVNSNKMAGYWLSSLFAFLLMGPADVVSFAAVFWAVTQRSPQEERCVTAQKTAAKETTSSGPVSKNANKELSQYPAILTEQAWSINYLLYGQKIAPRNFAFAGTRHAKREIPRWEKVRGSGRTEFFLPFFAFLWQQSSPLLFPSSFFSFWHLRTGSWKNARFIQVKAQKFKTKQKYFMGKIEPIKMTWLPMCGFIAQLVEPASHRYSRRTRVLIPLKSWIFFSGFFSPIE